MGDYVPEGLGRWRLNGGRLDPDVAESSIKTALRSLEISGPVDALAQWGWQDRTIEFPTVGGGEIDGLARATEVFERLRLWAFRSVLAHQALISMGWTPGYDVVNMKEGTFTFEGTNPDVFVDVPECLNWVALALGANVAHISFSSRAKDLDGIHLIRRLSVEYKFWNHRQHGP